MTDFQMTMLLVVWVAFGIIVGAVAGQRGKNGFLFFLFSIVLSPLIAFLVLIAIPMGDVVSNGKTKCPHCHGLIDKDVTCCMHCRRDILWSESPIQSQPSVPTVNNNIDTKEKTLTTCNYCNRMYMFDSMELSSNCPHCGAHKDIKPNIAAEASCEATCPECGKAFQTRSNIGIIEMLCPHCQTILKLDTAAA